MTNIVVREFNKDTSLNEFIREFIHTIEEVPFGNSDWQNRNVIVNGEMTPERAYRHSALRIMNRLQALNEWYYASKKEELEIKKLRRDFEKEEDAIEKDIIALDIEKRESMRPYNEKLVRDAVCEIQSLLPIIVSIGKLSRSQFEAGEAVHFKRRYKEQLKLNENQRGLIAMGAEQGDDFIDLFKKIVSQSVNLLEKNNMITDYNKIP